MMWAEHGVHTRHKVHYGTWIKFCSCLSTVYKTNCTVLSPCMESSSVCSCVCVCVCVC